MASEQDRENVKQLIRYLRGGLAFDKIEDCLKDIPSDKRGSKAGNQPYTLWELLYHIRIDQWDMIDFAKNPDHKDLKLPDDLWPKNPVPKDDAEWDDCLNELFKDQNEFIALLEAPGTDIYKPFPWANGPNLFRVAMNIANHNAYHLGQVVMARKMLGIWK
jgi:hypothetical protein